MKLISSGGLHRHGRIMIQTLDNGDLNYIRKGMNQCLSPGDRSAFKTTTVEDAQGDQAKIIVFGCGRTPRPGSDDSFGLLNGVRRMTVAFSRAEEVLIVVLNLKSWIATFEKQPVRKKQEKHVFELMDTCATTDR